MARDRVSPDPIFAAPRLAALYDAFDGARDDLDAYVAIIEREGARSILDVGCGTGELALRLAAVGRHVVGVDPAAASVEVARGKPGSTAVRWVVGEVEDLVLEGRRYDVAVLTGNVAQVFVDDAAWTGVLAALAALVRPGGLLVLETRDPAARAWESWTPEGTRRVRDVPGVGAVEGWCRVLSARPPLVTFRWTYAFAADGAVLTSDSTLRFRTRDEVEAGLAAAGFTVEDVRGAPDRPGQELVVLARRG